MLLTAFRLKRDVNTEKSSFGFNRFSISKLGKVHPSLPTLGCIIEPIESSTMIKTNIVKMIEFYNRKQGSVIVERLCWMFGSSIYPYRARYIRTDRSDTAGDVDLLFPNNLSKIHNTLSGSYVSFQSPIKYHLTSSAFPWQINNSHKQLNELCYRYENWIDNFAYAHDAWLDTEHFVNMFDNGPVPDDESNFRRYVLPRPPINDPFTVKNFSLPIESRNLVFEKAIGAPFDISFPIDLVIHHPEKTLYSPRLCQSTLNVLEQISLQYSDLDFEYILSGTAVVSYKINYLTSRYRNPFFKYSDINNECRWVISAVMEVIYISFPNPKILGDVRVRFIMTYGEEMLVELFDYDTNQCLGAIHIDLAMLSLCALNVAVSMDPF